MVSMLGNFFEAGNLRFPPGFLTGFLMKGVGHAHDSGISVSAV